MARVRHVLLTVAACAALMLLSGAAMALTTEEPAGPAREMRTPHQYVYVVYLNPADRECLPGYEERLDGALTAIQDWYRREMKRNGFGEMTFPLDRDEDGKLIVHLVNGTLTYDRGKGVSTDEVRENQVKPALLEEGIDIDQEHVVIVQNANYFKEVDGETEIEGWAPFCGEGDHGHGTAYCTDSNHLELSRMPATGLGGVAHELGHALGLPHNSETAAEAQTLGTALMGRGQYVFLAERAGAKKGAFLTKAHAIALSSHPLLKGNTKDVDVEPDCRFSDITFAQGKGEYIVRGRVESTPAAYALLAYHDDMVEAMDYEATSWVADFDEEGRFEAHVGELKPGPFELRLRACLENGDTCTLEFQFEIDKSLQIPIAELQRQAIYELHAKPAIEARDTDALLAAIGQLAGYNDIHYRRARAWYQQMTRTKPEPVTLSVLKDSVRQVPLSTVQWESATVGWEEPARDGLPGGAPLESGAQFHETGLYAHAPSSYVFDLGGNWKRFTSGYGLLNICKGSVIFVVKCDGEERFRSELVEDWVEGWVDVDLTGVKKLELIVEEEFDAWADCALWFSPIVTR
ncbi:MAG: NPCBM/NEW2 domain-containing protein [Verrucomicrobia bacterium]|nr:NPCBM/NEW2 domain-containing protein [Verrucomicrobiota bacterium]